jgi:hypothetical protein
MSDGPALSPDNRRGVLEPPRRQYLDISWPAVEIDSRFRFFQELLLHKPGHVGANPTEQASLNQAAIFAELSINSEHFRQFLKAHQNAPWLEKSNLMQNIDILLRTYAVEYAVVQRY